MTKKDKELLLKDLSARLPYGVKVAFFNEDLTYHSEHKTLIQIDCINNLNYSRLEDEDGNSTIIEFVKPYLFPMSSMTEEQESYMHFNTKFNIDRFETITPKIDEDDSPMYTEAEDWIALFDWFNKNHFDYRGLIEKGLALDATGLNIY